MLLREMKCYAFISAIVWRLSKGALGSLLASKWHSNLRQDANILGRFLGCRLLYDFTGRNYCKKDLKICKAVILSSTLVMMSFKQKVIWSVRQWPSLDQEQHKATSQNAGEAAGYNESVVESPKHVRSRSSTKRAFWDDPRSGSINSAVFSTAKV